MASAWCTTGGAVGCRDEVSQVDLLVDIFINIFLPIVVIVAVIQGYHAFGRWLKRRIG